MSSPVITISEHKTLVDAANIMNKNRIKQLPVLHKEKLVGVMTQTDVVRNIKKVIKYEQHKCNVLIKKKK